jgi:biopolymer transport protein ExbD
MGMERRQKKREVEVPTDSLSDVAFLLIIFFILTTSIQRLAGFTTELPSGEKNQTQTQQSEKTPTVAINDSQISLDDKPISFEELRKYLAGLNLTTKSGNERVILLDAEGSINYQQYFEVMASISSAGGVIGILTEEEGK